MIWELQQMKKHMLFSAILVMSTTYFTGLTIRFYELMSADDTEWNIDYRIKWRKYFSKGKLSTL